MPIDVSSFPSVAPPGHILIPRQGDPSFNTTGLSFQCVPFCIYETGPSNVSVQSSIWDRMGYGWQPSWGCPFTGPLNPNRTDGRERDPHPDCAKDACKSMEGGEFYEEMEKCFESRCKGYDDEFEYHLELIKTWKKFNGSVAETCEQRDVDLETDDNEEFTKEDFENKDKNDGDDGGSGAGIVRPWKGGLLLSALLFGGFFAAL